MRKKTPWPTKDAMQQVYEQHLWGGKEHDFYSGEGSHLDVIVQPYITAVSEFLSTFCNPISVCDLGCGDFNIGNQLVNYASSYQAIDIVPALIERNKQKYQRPNLEFRCLNIAEDKLPQAECVMIRQVLQHLSNKEVQAVLEKLNQYNYIILTEHIPKGEFEPNLDIISGQGTRLKKGSGLDILAPPFNFQENKVEELVRVDLGEKGVIVSQVIFDNE